MGNEFDFSGWATRNDLQCSDGRIIRRDAFKHCDGLVVPLVWNHQHNSPDEVLGHALLENRDEGVYAYGKFNDTESGQNAKLLVKHGDVNQLSIYANKLKQQGCNVVHGAIREVSLVLAGANPGAYIETIMMHGEDADEEAVIYTGKFLESEIPVSHSANYKKGESNMADHTNETVADVFDTLTEKQKKVVYALIGEALGEGSMEHSDEEETVEDVLATLTDEQKEAVGIIIDEILEEAAIEEDEEYDDEDFEDEEDFDDEEYDDEEDFDDEEYEEDDIEHSEGGYYNMKYNVFDGEEMMGDVLTHSEMQAILSDAKSFGSLKEAVIAHGIEDLDLMFPDHEALENEPGFIKRDDDWVAKVLGGVHHTPFARIKTIFADITAAEARAKGYQKGNLKIEEVFKLLKRVTGPTTVYKKQKLDRDDMLDLDKSFNVLPFLKKEIRMMLNEEMARAFLVGDGRDPVEQANDKIDEECIRPIWKMEDLFTVKVAVPVAANVTESDRAKAFIKACIKSRKLYKGSGNPTMFMPEDMLTDCLLIEDVNGRVIYDSMDKLKAALRVSDIVPVPVMENLTRKDDEGHTFELAAIYVNLKDYNVGTDKGGEIGFFEDFDIDYNQMKYLMETRCSGTLVKPYSAVAIEFTAAAAE